MWEIPKKHKGSYSILTFPISKSSLLATINGCPCQPDIPPSISSIKLYIVSHRNNSPQYVICIFNYMIITCFITLICKLSILKIITKHELSSNIWTMALSRDPLQFMHMEVKSNKKSNLFMASSGLTLTKVVTLLS